jgi:hypothetical protein
VADLGAVEDVVDPAGDALLLHLDGDRVRAVGQDGDRQPPGPQLVGQRQHLGVDVGDLAAPLGRGAGGAQGLADPRDPGVAGEAARGRFGEAGLGEHRRHDRPLLQGVAALDVGHELGIEVPDDPVEVEHDRLDHPAILAHPECCGSGYWIRGRTSGSWSRNGDLTSGG